MSTTKSKPSTKPIKASEPKPKYNIGQKVFIVSEERSRYGEILQAEVTAVRSIKLPSRSDSGKISGSYTEFEYDVRTANGDFEENDESELYPTFVSVATAFANHFTTLLK